VNTQELVKHEENKTPYVILYTPVAEIDAAVKANLGEENVNASDFDRIKVPAGGGTSWTVEGLDGEETVKELTGIIVAWRDTRAYWSVPMDQSDGNMPPDCYSLDAKKADGEPGGECGKCEFAKFGSDAKGEGQACKAVRQLFLVREGSMLPEIVSLPASSLKPARQYFMRLASKAVPCYSLITRIGLEKTKNTQGIVYSRATFSSAGRLTPEQAEAVKKYASMLQPYLEANQSAPTAADAKGGGAASPEGADASDGEVI
jgi:hypothetical protein